MRTEFSIADGIGKLQEHYDLSLEEAEAAVTGLKIDAEGMKLETNL
jgi:hypothetical protein